jgi:hypothetical protein
MVSATHTVPAPRPLQSLRRILRANGVFCTFAGVTALAGAGGLAARTGIASPLLLILGGVTLAYGLFLLGATSPLGGPFLVEWSGWTTFFVDAMWVAMGLAVLLNGRLPLTSTGRGLVLLVAGVVAVFALLQLRALRHRS